MTTTTATPATDRRDAPRFHPAFRTICRLGPAWPRIGLVWNLSRTGMSMLMGDPPPARAELGAVLAQEGESGGLPIRLHVVHVREVMTGDYVLGARFDRPLDDAELASLQSASLPDDGHLPKKG